MPRLVVREDCVYEFELTPEEAKKVEAFEDDVALVRWLDRTQGVDWYKGADIHERTWHIENADLER